MWAPERIDSPTASASSWMTVSTICSGRLVQPGVDDLHARVAQRAGDDLRAAVVAVEPGLGDDDADLRWVGAWTWSAPSGRRIRRHAGAAIVGRRASDGAPRRRDGGDRGWRRGPGRGATGASTRRVAYRRAVWPSSAATGARPAALAARRAPRSGCAPACRPRRSAHGQPPAQRPRRLSNTESLELDWCAST